MKPVVIIRHVDCEGPGYLADFLQGRGIPFIPVCIDACEAVPENVDGMSGLVLMGGSMSVNDHFDWIGRELNLIREAMRENIPVLGHCLGGQLIARALGGSITANPVREFGWHVVYLQDNPEARTWFGPDIESFDCFHWHGERYTLPDGAVPLLSSRFCENQAFVLGRAMAMQCHIEMTAGMVRVWAERFSGQLAQPSESIQSADQMLMNLEARCHSLNRVADRVYERWTAWLGT